MITGMVIPVSIYFIHSVHRVPEVDLLYTGRDGFIVRAIAFQEHGAGVPSSPSDIGAVIQGESGGFIVYQNGSYRLGYSIAYNVNDVIGLDILIGGRIHLDSSVCSLLNITMVR